MLIAIADMTMSPEDAAKALPYLTTLAQTVRAMPGNRAYRPLPDPETPGRIAVLHEWEDKAAFDAFCATPAYADMLAELKPKLTAPPVVRHFNATPLA